MDIGSEWKVMLHSQLPTWQALVTRDIFTIQKSDPFQKQEQATDLHEGG
jgi:hypothetical protein